MNVKIGEWVAYTEGYAYWEDDDKVTFPTKQAAIQYVGSMKLDTRPTPRVNRLYKGSYIYRPQDCDTGEYSTDVYIERVTPQNVDEFKELVQNQLDEDPLSED